MPPTPTSYCMVTVDDRSCFYFHDNKSKLAAKHSRMGTHFAFAPRFEDENDDYSIIMVKALADRLAEVQVSHVADQGRNRTLFYCVFGSHYRV